MGVWGEVVGDEGGRVGTYVSRLMGWGGGRVRGIARAEGMRCKGRELRERYCWYLP